MAKRGDDDDIDKAIKVINEVAAAHPDVLSEPHGPWAKVVTLNDSSVDIQSRVWCKPEHYWDVMFDLKKSIKEAFDKNDIQPLSNWTVKSGHSKTRFAFD